PAALQILTAVEPPAEGLGARVDVATPTHAERCALLRAALAPDTVAADALERTAAQFPLPPERLAEAVASARAQPPRGGRQRAARRRRAPAATRRPRGGERAAGEAAGAPRAGRAGSRRGGAGRTGCCRLTWYAACASWPHRSRSDPPSTSSGASAGGSAGRAG